MRPVRVSIEGFSAYRTRVVVNFDDVDYFSLSGPTGSGKSSLIDAMVFALYGRVPRLGGATVAPVISSGKDQATVSFDFMVDDTVYTVVRDLHRTKSGGATTREARLERGPESLESGAKNVTAAVEELLSLSFEDFTRTVILPQGEFARFLTATPAERQQLLRGLLGLDVYGEVAALARSRESMANSVAQESRSRLEGLETPDEETRVAAEQRLSAINEMADSVGERELLLLSHEARVNELEGRISSIDSARIRLEDMEPPERLDELGGLLARAADFLEVLEHKAEALALESIEIESALAELPSRADIERHETTATRLEKVTGELSKLGVDGIAADLETAEADVVMQRESVESVTARLEELRVQHAAHGIAVLLAAGDTCPVCSNLVKASVGSEPIDDLEAAREQLMVDRDRLDDFRNRVSDLNTRLAAARANEASLRAQKAELTQDLDSGLDPETLVQLKGRIAELTDKLAAARSASAEATEAKRVATREFEDLSELQRSLGNLLMRQREAIADLKPEPSESDDPIVQWKELLTWRGQKLEWLKSDNTEALQDLESAIGVRDQHRAAIENDLAALGVEANAAYSVAVARAQEQARHRVEQHHKAAEEAETLTTTIEKANRQSAVAHALGLHLKADRFERWLMVGAIAGLVSGANALLAQLSDNSYSLVSDDDGSFDVIDHRNADELRPISTLSGGETFLVSLALALSLAETLSSAGGGALDAIILDEGFGTLDDELLEVVAAVLEDLAGRGLMVGIITHVKELASLAPVRFRVTKEPQGSRVEKIS
jgi:DNA repair protein SbcC/Rad50